MRYIFPWPLPRLGSLNGSVMRSTTTVVRAKHAWHNSEKGCANLFRVKSNLQESGEKTENLSILCKTISGSLVWAN